MNTHIDEDGTFFVEGTPIGQVHEADDGALLLVGFDGEILDASTPDGQPLDAGDYTVEEPEPEYVTREEFELEQRLAALEAQLTPQQAGQSPQIDEQQVIADIEARLEAVASQFGRDLTTKEVDAIFTNVSRQLEAGQEMNFETAAFEAHLRRPEQMSRGERTGWIAQRLADEERQPEPDTEAPAPDLKSREGKTAYVLGRLEGRIDDERAEEIRSGKQPEPDTAEAA